MLIVTVFNNDHQIQLFETAQIKIILWTIISTEKFFGQNFDMFDSEN